MFNATGHISSGVLLGALCNAPAAGMVFIAFGSLLPDVDHPASTLGRWNPFARWMTHRGFTHTWLGTLVLSAPFYLFGSFCFKWVLLGCISHLLADKLYSFLPRKKRFSIRLW